MAVEALRAYQGDLLVYVGEGNGDACADDDFFAELEDGWELVGRSPGHVSFFTCAVQARSQAGLSGERSPGDLDRHATADPAEPGRDPLELAGSALCPPPRSRRRLPRLSLTGWTAARPRPSPTARHRAP